MKVEQRIGRVDRIGQTQPIWIFNLWVKDTIEERVLDILENRIRLFRRDLRRSRLYPRRRREHRK